MLPTDLAPPLRQRAELRRYQCGAVVLAALAIGLAALLLPRGDELLLIHVKNRDIDRARALLSDTARQHISTAASVVARNELFLMEGRVDEALAQLEAYARARPGDVEAWNRLAEMYADAQRFDDQVRAWAHVYELQPSVDLARRLVAFYRRSGDEAAESDQLYALVTGGEATAEESLHAARLAAALARPTQALDCLERLRRREPGRIDYPALELYVSLIVEHEGTSRLAGRIESLPIVQAQPDVRVALAQTLTSWDRADAAVALFDAPDGGEAPPSRLALRARVALGTGEAARTARELATLDAARPLGAEPLAALIDLLLSLNDYEAVASVLAHPARTADPRLVGLAVGHAVAHGDRPRAQALVVRFGDAGLMESPMLALDLAIERGDTAAARRWIEIADASGPDSAQVAALGQYELRLGEPAPAFNRLAALVRSGGAPAWALTDFTQAAIALDRVDEAWGLLAASGIPTAGAARARLAASAGRTDLVDRWMSSPVWSAEDPETLRDVYYRLADRGELARAAAVAAGLLDRQHNEANALLLGQALLAAGRPQDALEPLRRSGAGVESQRAYDAALVAALNAGADVGAEVRRVLGQRLRDASLPPEQRALAVEGLWAAGERASVYDAVLRLAREDLTRWLTPLVESATAAGEPGPAIELVGARLDELDARGETAGEPRAGARPAADVRGDLVRALIELEAPDERLLPPLRRMAYEVGDTWVYAYDERLASRSSTADRVDLWTSVAHSASASVDQRRGAAARLAELGAIGAAADVLEAVAADAGPDEADVLQLVSLWGPRAGDTAIAWLVARLQSAAMEDRPAWIEHLVRVGGGRAAASAMPTLPDEAPTALVAAWILAHESAGEPQLLDEALQQVILRPTSTIADLRAAGRAALAHERPDLAAAAFGLVVGQAGDDREALRWLGALAFYDGRMADARMWLRRYLAADGTEAEALYQLGEIALADHDAVGARAYYAQALAALESDRSGPATPVLRANTLVRLDERERAAAAFNALLAADPTLDHVRADYVVALLQWGDYARARTLLDQAARPDAAPAAGLSSGARRLDLLRIQVLSHNGRYGEALDVLDDLAGRFPSDPDVVLARARFDEQRGRSGAAGEGYARAHDLAPQRDDIARLISQLADEQSPRAGIESEFRTISNGWEERYQRLVAQSTAAGGPLALTVERLRLSARLVRRADGHVGPVETDLGRFEATGAFRVGADTVLGGSVFGTARGPGGGFRFAHDDLRGRWEGLAEAGRPFWEFLESAADDGRRDRVAVQRQWRFRPDTAAWAYGGWHRYRVAAGAATTSAAITLGVVRTVRPANPAISLQYGLDKEQRLDATVVTTPEGEPFMPIPLVSREVHLFGAVSRTTFGGGWEIEGTGGYTIDRLGGRGSFFTARLSPPRGARVGLDLWADQRLFIIATSQRVFRAGGRLSVRF